ncbi:MAG: hypothetical protein Q4E91_03825, partial [Lachnospiraceae bacterium]|nr:hypothetical protein [Lachnospiraceae bacterium]
NSLQEAENTITGLKGEITKYKEKVSLFTKIMYGLIGLSIILLFIVINLLLKKKDLKSELNDYRSYGYTDNKKAQKAQKKAEKKQKKNAQPFGDEDAFFDEPMQQPAAGYGRRQDPGPAPGGYGNPSGPMYAELDVQPQKSQKKAKQMPQYEQPGQFSNGQQPKASGRKAAASQKQQAEQPAPSQGKPAGKGKKKDVEINMIDL